MSEFLHAAFVEPLTQSFFQKALIGGSIVAIVCGVVGCLVVLRRMAFLGDALSHAMIAGVGGGYLFMKVLFGVEAYAPAMLIGSVIAAVVTVALIAFVSRVSRIKEDASIGIMYTGVFAAGVVLVSMFRNYIHIDLMHFIMGDVLGVADTDLMVAAFVAAAVLTVMLLFFRHFQLVSFDPVMAAAIGLPVVLIDYTLTTCVSLVVVSAVSMVGVILVVGLLITPAATAYLLSDRLHRMMILAGFFGVTSVVGGLYLSIWLDSAGGGAIMVFCTLQFLLVLVFAPRYGLLADWLRRRRMVPQQITEDILKAILRGPQEECAVADLMRELPYPHGSIRRAVQSLTADGTLIASDSRVGLSENGRREALRVVRAHRLWESYLAHVGAAEADLHNRAHDLEHIGGQEASDYLSHLLGHPETDPHGAPIPAESDVSTGKEPMQLSALKVGQEARTILVPSNLAEKIPFRRNDRLKLVERPEGRLSWVVEDSEGKRYEIEHDFADQIWVNARINEPAEK